MRVRPASDVAGSIDAGPAGFEKGIDHDPIVDSEPRPFGQSETRPHADAGNDEVGLEHRSAFEASLLALDRNHRVLEMENDAVLLVQPADEIAELRPENPLQGPLAWSDDMDLDPPCTQRRRHFEADE